MTVSLSVCPATWEAVVEQGDDCPLCDRPASAHYSERWHHQQRHDHDWKPVGLDSWRCECGATKTAIV